MPSTIRGQAILKFGTNTLSGYIVADEEIEKVDENFQIENEAGDVVTDIAGFGQRTTATYNFLPLSTAVEPTPGAVLTGPGGLRVVVRTVRRIRARKMPEMWRLTGAAYPLVAL